MRLKACAFRIPNVPSQRLKERVLTELSPFEYFDHTGGLYVGDSGLTLMFFMPLLDTSLSFCNVSGFHFAREGAPIPDGVFMALCG